MNNISIQDFAVILKQELLKRKSNWDIRIEDIKKTNDVIQTALVIMSDKTNISPIIYLESFFTQYVAGCELEMILDGIERLYDEHNMDDAYFDMNQFFDFQKIKKRICFKIVNAEKNKELLRDVPHRCYLDFAIIYYVLLPDEECLQGVASILINNKMLECWKMTECDMYDIAFENTRCWYKYVVRSMQDVLIEMLYNESEVSLEEGLHDLCEEKVMYYASNQTKVGGSSFLLYNDLLEKFAREHGNFYILPSSIHELLFVPCALADLDEHELCEMVGEINQNCLDAQEFLSNNIYRFDADKKVLEMITK